MRAADLEIAETRMTSTSYHPLGRSGLRVSRLALGTMTFGNGNGWGCDRETSLALFDRYIESGGNFVDTADVYAGGTSETWLGEFIAERGLRDEVVLATKFTNNFSNTTGNPNAAGNGRKNIMRSLEASLRRLKTDYVDLYLLHTWDRLTPVEEVLRTMTDLVAQGKIRHFALSDVPAWYAARAKTLSDLRGFEPPCALQMEYSLVARGIDYEFPPMCQELGMGLMAWSPLGGGLLSGKYQPHVDPAAQAGGRLKATAAVATAALRKTTPQNWEIIAELDAVAKELGRSMPQVAINWVANRPAVSSVVLGATRVQQLEDTLGALDFALPPDLEARLDAASRLAPMFPYTFIDAFVPRMHGRASVTPQPPRFGDAAAGRTGGWR